MPCSGPRSRRDLPRRLLQRADSEPQCGPAGTASIPPEKVCAGGKGFRVPLSRRRQDPNHAASVDSLLPAKIAKRAEVGQDEGHAKLILSAHGAEVDAAVFKRKPAATAIVADLSEFVL